MKSSITSEWRVPALLILLSLVPAAAGTFRLGELASGAEITEANARFFAMPVPVVLHIFAVIPYSILGALQFASPLRRRPWHRVVGRVLVVCGFVAVLTGLWMAHFYPWPAADGMAVYAERLVFGVGMLVSLVLAIDAIRRRDFGSHPASHGAWMTRAYAIGMGAGTQVLTHLPWFVLVDESPKGLPRAVMMGAGWMINVVVAEWAIRRSFTGHRSAPAIVIRDVSGQQTGWSRRMILRISSGGWAAVSSRKSSV